MPCNRHANIRVHRQEQGVVLLIALIVLVAMTLAGIGLVRSVDTGTMVAGNMAFKQAVTLAADTGAEVALTWLTPNQAVAAVNADQAASGYYATNQKDLDLTNSLNDAALAAVDWEQNDCQGLSFSVCIKPSAPVMVGDNSVSYIIHRLCQKPGTFNDPANSCVTYQSRDSGSPNRDGLLTGDVRFEPLPVPYYRITARVVGPRNTTSFVQTVVHF